MAAMKFWTSKDLYYQDRNIIKNIVTVNFENAGKKTIIADIVLLEKINAKN